MDYSSEISDSCDEGKPFKCQLKSCNASFSKKWKLDIHFRKHTGERPFVCDVPNCKKAYMKSAHLKRHKCLTHETSERKVCEYENCGKVFNNKYSLKKHFNRKHARSSYAFTCAECSQGFNKRTELQKHVYLHTGVATHSCDKCDATFTTTRLLNKHKNHHKTYECDCGEIFHRWTLLCQHRRETCTMKQAYKCIICDKEFSQASNLKQHALTHVEESQRSTFQCTYEGCNRSYFQKKNLVQHIDTFHKKIKASIKCTCYICERTLSSKSALKTHIQVVHNKVEKVKKPRATRKDKGKPKVPMASILSGIILKSDTKRRKSKTNKDQAAKNIDDSNKDKKLLENNDVNINCNPEDTSLGNAQIEFSNEMSDILLLQTCDTALHMLHSKMNEMQDCC